MHVGLVEEGGDACGFGGGGGDACGFGGVGAERAGGIQVDNKLSQLDNKP